ncbi:MAG: 30S ribosomal protein S8 [Candidatus Pacearchaeota archaeon]
MGVKMVVRDWLSNALNHFMNCLRVGKKETEIWPVNNLMLNVFEIMKKHGYIESYEISKEKNARKVKVKLGNIHECKAIKPRYVVRKKFYDKYMQRYLPARNIGILIISTNQGLMTHSEAIEKGLGGVLIAYCY